MACILVFRAFCTLRAEQQMFPNGGRARARERKRERGFLAPLNWSAEPCELSSY